MSEYKGVLVYCEVVDGKLAANAAEMIGAGKMLSGELGEELAMVLIGSDIGGAAKDAASYSAGKIFVVDEPVLKNYSNDAYLAVLDKVVSQVMPQVILMGQTTIGRDLAPRLAFRLDTGATMDCIRLGIDPVSKRMIQTKTVYGGKALADYICETNPQVATLRAKTMNPAEKDETAVQAEIIKIESGINRADVKLKVLEKRSETATDVKLEDAKVIVCGGRGIGSEEGFQTLGELAALMKGAVGASRPACDAGWISGSRQIGLTGKIVSPDLYFAVALSGTSQHMSGCAGSKTIVAINKDHEASIFGYAQYGLASDWKKIVPLLIEKIKNSNLN